MTRATAVLEAISAFPVLDFADAFGQSPILILAPHPDDESLGCGGLIAEACARGCPPLVAILTDGSRSHPGSLAYPPARLRELRAQETRNATTKLGLAPDRLLFLGYKDTEAPGSGQPLADAARQVADLATAWQCGTIATTWGADPHCDHAAAAAIAGAACTLTGGRRLAYPIWAWTLPAESDIGDAPARGFRLDVTAHLDAKRAAIHAHRSQYAGLIDDDPDGFQMETGFIEKFLGPTEVFLELDAGR